MARETRVGIRSASRSMHSTPAASSARHGSSICSHSVGTADSGAAGSGAAGSPLAAAAGGAAGAGAAALDGGGGVAA